MMLKHIDLHFLSVASVLTVVGCNPADTSMAMQVQEVARQLASARLDTDADVQQVVSNAIAADRAILFIHVDWAPMEAQRTAYARFMIEYARRHPRGPVGFHYIDCTSVSADYAPLKSIPGWTELQNEAGMSLVHGKGELVWMERGHVLHVEPIGHFESTALLIQKTEALLPPRHR